MLDQEILRIQKQHKDELAEQEENINLLREALEARLEDQVASDSEMMELKALVCFLTGQIRGKGRAPEVLEARGGGGGNKPPPPKMRGAGEGAPDDDNDDDDDDDDKRSHRRGKWPEGPRRRKNPPPL